jgi:hypothetical protein
MRPLIKWPQPYAAGYTASSELGGGVELKYGQRPARRM